MYAKITLQRTQIADFQNILTLMFHLNFNFINYMEFWSIGNVLQRIAKVNYQNNFSNRKTYTLKLAPNEIESFILLVAQSENLLAQTPYYNSMLLEITNQLHKQVLELEHKKTIFANKQNLTIPKLIHDEQSRN